MTKSISELAQCIAIAIRTGTNGMMSASTKLESIDRYAVHVVRQTSERESASVGKVVVFDGGDEPRVDLSSLDANFGQEVLEFVVQGRDLSFATLKGRDVVCSIFATAARLAWPKAFVVSHLADACVCAGEALGTHNTFDGRTDYARGVLHQAEAMQPGLCVHVVRKLKTDTAISFAPGFAWLARAIGVVQTCTPAQQQSRGGRKPKVRAS